MFSLKAPAVTFVLMSLVPIAPQAVADDQEVGATLHEKSDVAIANVPAEAMAVAREKRPALTFTKAEREMRGGHEYIDLEGHDDTGNVIELDLMHGETGWVVVEIQRDVMWEVVPTLVQEELMQNVPGIKPDRIIESDQDNGTIVYEFFVRDNAGKESKYEVSLTGEEAMFLKEEWKH
ncbi:hypothetical protein [Kordiimonas gwangyangensis]|uniref:hypothetical protein n=1 Tax=Kordiimonas gwangyangensis TaxID=288022 RepID=UPI0003624502|nr:hypothetical protein [Kordiimonas gwangyangensis]